MVDLISHALWAYAFTHSLPDSSVYVISSLLPDIAWGVPAIVLLFASGRGFKEIRQMGKNFRLSHEEARKRLATQPYFRFVQLAYHASHSWLVAAIVSLLVYLSFPAIAIPFAFGVFLHLAMDIFVHKDSVSGQMPLYPVSRWNVRGFIHWSNRKFMVANYILLAVVYALMVARVI